MSAACIKQFDTNEFRIAVYELDNNRFIATLWTKGAEHESDRAVFAFETFGGAADKALDLMFENMVPNG